MRPSSCITSGETPRSLRVEAALSPRLLLLPVPEEGVRLQQMMLASARRSSPVVAWLVRSGAQVDSLAQYGSATPARAGPSSTSDGVRSGWARPWRAA